MRAAIQTRHVTVYQGDALAVLREMPAESVDCCVTSPPYWGLRDYGTGTWSGGTAECDHKRALPGTGGDPKYGPNKGSAGGAPSPMGAVCSRCGAARVDAQLGLELTPALYVAALVEVFREVRRVLRPHGTVWLNLGDTYAAQRSYQVPDSKYVRMRENRGSMAMPAGMKPKDMVGIPWRVAFALQADGWYLRSDIIWAKPNPMPESVTDRPTKAHEYVFLLAKSQRYFYDSEAIREPFAAATLERVAQVNFDNQTGGPKDYGAATNANRSARRSVVNLKGRIMPPQVEDARANGWEARARAGMPNADQPETMGLVDVDGAAPTPQPRGHSVKTPQEGTFAAAFDHWGEAGWNPGGRNARSVWSIPTEPYPEAHFATFPQELPRRAIKAGTSEQGYCAVCHAPRVRLVTASGGVIGQSWHDHEDDLGVGQRAEDNAAKGGHGSQRATTGWAPSCDHAEAEAVPGVVLDPFAGSGTTLAVARDLGRQAVGIELNEAYIPLIERRTAQEALW